MTKTLYTNAHICKDGHTAFEKGALLVEDGKIDKVFYQIPKDIALDVKVIDMQSNYILPSIFSYVSIDDIDVQDDFSMSLAIMGVASFVATLSLKGERDIDKLIKFKPNRYKYSKCFGLHLIIDKSDIPDDVCDWLNTSDCIISLSFKPNVDQAVIDIFKKANRKVFIQNGNQGHISLNIDGYWNLLSKHFTYDPFRPNIFSSAMLSEDKYINVEDNLYPDSLKLLFKNHDMRYVLASGSIKSYLDLGLDLMDISNIFALNYYRLYNISKEYGALIHGKQANFIVLDKNYDIIASFVKGELVR